MKKTSLKKQFIVFLFPLLALSLMSCPREADPSLYLYRPVLMKRADLEQSVQFFPPRPIKNPGKIYIKDGYLFLNEKNKGLHIIDNRNPASPQKIGFLQVFGNNDLAVKGDFLYLDNAVDLLTVSLSDPANPHLLSRKKNVFPETSPPNLNFIPQQYTKENRPKDTVIAYWERND